MKNIFKPVRALFLFIALIILAFPAPAQISLSPEDATARLAFCRQLARETNRKELVDEVKSIADQVKSKLTSGDLAAADQLIRDLEPRLGIDPGGWSMGGLKIFHPRPEMLAKAKASEPKLAAAMAKDDPGAVREVIAEMRIALGDQAGLPDARRKGNVSRRQRVTDQQVAEYFIKALANDNKKIRQVSEGKPLPDQMLRFYAVLVDAFCEIRPALLKHQPAAVPEMDQLVFGACKIMTGLQQADGHFPFPDLRGKNIRFGEMIDKLVAAQPDAVKGGWVIAVDPTGGSQFDTGRSGSALLRAGLLYTNSVWSKAGRRAADWALTQPCVPNFNYNSFSVGLLAHAYRDTHEAKYLAGALRKLEVGVAPGQVASGRWIDSHNARTVYHVIILQSLNDLAEALPADQKANRDLVKQITAKAVATMLEEFEKIGITTTAAMRELIRYTSLYGPDERVRKNIELAASVIREKCVAGDRAKFGVSPEELAALVRAWKN